MIKFGKTLRRIRVAEKHLAMHVSFLAYVEQGGTLDYAHWCHPQLSGRTAWLRPRRAATA
jgi:hypothetical protein